MAGVELYLIRHGIAEERGAAWPDDTKRPLTGKGEARLREAAAGLSALGVGFDVIFTSPLTRARQTAEALAGALSKTPPVETLPSLAPGVTAARLLADLAERRRHARLALVGHEPDLGVLAARLIGAKRALEFKKGAVCRIDLEDLPPSQAGVLRWFATPRLLRLAGRPR